MNWTSFLIRGGEALGVALAAAATAYGAQADVQQIISIAATAFLTKLLPAQITPPVR